MKKNSLLNIDDADSTKVEVAYGRWRTAQMTAGANYLPILRAVEKVKEGVCRIKIEGGDLHAFAGIDPQVWSIFASENAVNTEKVQSSEDVSSVDVYFKRLLVPSTLQEIYRHTVEVKKKLSPLGIFIVEQTFDKKSFENGFEETCLRWRYVLSSGRLRILDISTVVIGNNPEQMEATETYLTMVACREEDEANLEEVRRVIGDRRALLSPQFFTPIGHGEHTNLTANSDLSDLAEMRYTLQAQTSAAETMIASLSDSAILAKDASRRLLKVEKRVLALRKQTSVFLPVTYPWSLFAGLVLSVVKRIKAKRKKKRFDRTEQSADFVSVSKPERGIVVEKRTVHVGKGISDNPKILILKLDHIGDFFLALPAVDLLKKAWPGANLTLVCSPTNGSLARASGCFDTVIEYKFSAELSQDVQKAQLENYANIKALVPERYDLAIDLRHDPDTRPLLLFVNSGLKAGFQETGRSFTPLDISLPPMEVSRGFYKNAHNVHRLMLLSSHVVNTVKGFDISDATTSLVATGAFDNPFKGCRYAVFAPGGGTDAKKWAPSKFAELARHLVLDDGLKLIVVGGLAESPYRDEIFSAIPSDMGLDLIGSAPLVDLALILSGAEVVIGTDTGATHLAALIGVPTIAVFSGVADHNIWEPTGKSVTIVRKPLACSPCHIARIEDCVAAHKCMNDIDVETVLCAVRANLYEGDV